MGLESANTIAQLNPLWPLGTDPRSQGDDHLRLIKKVLQADALSKKAGGTLEEGITISNTGPFVAFNETDAAGSDGMYRLLGLAAGNFALQRAAAADWSATISYWRAFPAAGADPDRFLFDVPASFGSGVLSSVSYSGWTASANANGFAVNPGQLNVGADSAASATAALIGGYHGGTQTFIVRRNGNVANTNNSYGAISDATRKHDIADATPKLEDLNRLRVVNFVLDDDPAGLKQLGLVGQEVREVFPGLVEEDEEGLLSVKYSVLVPMLVKALQELTGRLALLEGMAGFGGRDS